MAHGKWNVIGRWLSRRFEPSCPPHSNQVASETVHRLAATERLNCESCVEENKVCECGDGNELKGDSDNSVVANSSFTQSVFNMAGMLIGKAIKNFLLIVFMSCSYLFFKLCFLQGLGKCFLLP